MKEYIKKYWFDYIFAFVLIIVVAIAVTIKFGYVYSTNDDVMMRNIVNGNFTGSPDSHIVFISFMMASLWKLLYEFFPNVSWYDLFTVGLHYLCWFLVAVRFGQYVKGKKHKIIVISGIIALLVTVDLEYMIMPQFTVLSAQLAGVAVMWMFTRKKDENIEWMIDYSVIFAMLLLSSLFRSEPFLLALPIVGLAILYDIWKNSDNQRTMTKRIKKIVIYIGIFGFLYLIAGLVNKNAYGNAEWSEFMRSQESRPIIYDYSGVPSYSIYEDSYNNLGIDYSDWMAFYTYNCELAEDLNADKMEGVAEISLLNLNEYINVNGEVNWLKSSLYTLCMLLFEEQIQPIGVVIIIAYVSVFLLCYKEDDKKTCIATMVILLFYMIVYFVLIERGRYPERVMYGIYFVQLMCLLAFIAKYVERICYKLENKKFWLITAQVVCLAVIGLSLTYSWQSAEDEQNKIMQNVDDWECVNDYFTNNSEARYCIDTITFNFTAEKLFSDAVESDNLIRMGGWILNSPLQQQRMQNQGVENLVQQVAESEHFYIVQEEIKGTEWIDTILNEKGYDVEAVVVDVIATPGGRTFEVIQMQ